MYLSQVGGAHCRKGVCVVKVSSCAKSILCHQFGIELVSLPGVSQALDQRRKIRVDPYRQGFEHREDIGAVGLSTVRLCFQVSWLCVLVRHEYPSPILSGLKQLFKAANIVLSSLAKPQFQLSWSG